MKGQNESMPDIARGPGRPPGKRYDKKTAFDLEQATYDRVVAIAAADGIAVATWIRQCVERSVKRRNPPEQPPV